LQFDFVEFGFVDSLFAAAGGFRDFDNILSPSRRTSHAFQVDGGLQVFDASRKSLIFGRRLDEAIFGTL
jgi:hypothetical protein